MAYIRIIHEHEAEGELARSYKRWSNADGSVDNVLKVHALNPASLEAHCALYAQAMHKPSPLTRAEREMIGIAVSRLNRCAYCVAHHVAGLVGLLPDDRQHLARNLATGDEADLSPRERALVAYAERLTSEPASVRPEHIDALRAAGLTDREILDAAQAAAYFAYANRIVLGLGAALESRHHAPGQHPAQTEA